MSEPEDVLLDGAHHATLFAQRLWRRHIGSSDPQMLHLVDVRARLELFVCAAFGLSLTFAVAEPPAIPSWFGRMGRRIPRHLIERRTLFSTDGTHIRLPRTVPLGDTPGNGLMVYRLFAAEAALRAARKTHLYLPDNPLVRDLYLVREAAATDGQLVSVLPGMGPALRAARVDALTSRPSPKLLTHQELAVEAEILTVLSSDPDISVVCDAPCPEASLAWAKDKAARIRSLVGDYRGLPAVVPWGCVTPPPAILCDQVTASTDNLDDQGTRQRVSLMKRRPQVRQAPDDEDDEGTGIWMVQLDDPQEHVEDPMGLQRPTDRDDTVDPDDLADSLSELPEARLVTAPGRPREILASDDPPPARAVHVAYGASTSLVYPEWDYRIQAYHVRGATVREKASTLGDPDWATDVLTRRAALLNAVRRRFERLRPRRLRLGRQFDGPEVDLAAYVAHAADRHAGHTSDDRLYEIVRPARRDIAIALLVDISGSTDSWVTENLRVIDVEKEALLVVTDALDALGDPYMMVAFSGEGPESVTVVPLKDFDERSGPVILRRIAALEPDRYTRMGAPLRHATARLMTRPARHRLLLVLSDGKPNDVDLYEGRYGIEDTRQAVAEARLQSIHPFCVTVDRNAPHYMSRIFGAGGYAVIHHPEHLPSVLVDILRRLVIS